MDWPARTARLRDSLRVLNRALPETARGFGALSKGVAEGKGLTHKEKEFVALGIAVAVRCDDCIGLHVEALLKAGATRAEVADVLAMCVQMGGGPALMYAAHAMQAWDQTATGVAATAPSTAAPSGA
jgi:AhpD family alkylhydroperoxidase